MSYKVIEEAIRMKLIRKFAPELSANRCIVGDLDTLFRSMHNEDARIGVLIEFEGGRKLSNAPYNGKMWEWAIDGFVLIRYLGDSVEIEQVAREIIEVIYGLVDDDRTLGGKCALASVVSISRLEPAAINEVPFYWVPFTITAKENLL